MNEEIIQYRKLGMMILAKLLDDICPTFHGEEEEEKDLRIKQRIKFFKKSEVELDKEWKMLENEAAKELKKFISERDVIFSKIAKTNNTERIKVKIKGFEAKKQARVDYLTRKLDREVHLLTEKLSGLNYGSRKHTQITNKIATTQKVIADKIKKTESRYNTIIKNTLNSDNSERVSARLEQSKGIWKRKYGELKTKHDDKEEIFNNRSMEFDQIRIALDGLKHETKKIEHWCTLSGVSLKECYTEAIKRARMIKRDTKDLEEILKQVVNG